MNLKNSTGAAIGGLILMAGISNIISPLFACGFPRIKNLLGLKIKDVRVEHFPAELDSISPEDLDMRCPECLDIKFDNQTLTINLEEKLIAGSVKDLGSADFGMNDIGSGGLGILFLGIPGMIIGLPLIIICNTMWYAVYKWTDMDVNYYLFWRRIKNNLDADTRHKLKEALINTSRQWREGVPGQSGYGDNNE